jgi:methylglutamate dehydrogenase subunit D
VSLVESAPIAATIVAGRGAATAVAEAFGRFLDAEVVDAPKRVVGRSIELVGVGPGRWIALQHDPEKSSDFSDEIMRRRKPLDQDGNSISGNLSLAAACGAHASIVDQTGGFLRFDASGAAMDQVLAKLSPVDVHPDAFPVGAAATCDVSRINVVIWRTGPAAWRFLVGRSFALAFIRAFAVAAAEFGLDLGPPSRA